MTPLAQRLSEARERRGLSRRRLSLQAGLTDSVVGQIERGDIYDPSSDTLGKLAQVLDVSVDWLIFGEDISPAEAVA